MYSIARGYPAGPRPLYHLAEVNAAAPEFVTIHGGEKATDAAIALGLPGQSGHPIMVATINQVIAAANRQNVKTGIPTSDPGAILRLREQGLRSVSSVFGALGGIFISALAAIIPGWRR